ncbi:MAG TPA: tetratricopeptide repeat protein [Terriglobia bacterium]|nr:tetratricopeptide repeat protein [Terriglobia bacterium]
MPSRRKHLAGALCILLPPVSVQSAPQARSISGVVETKDGKPVARVEVRVTNAGGTVSSDSGEFAIPLPSQFEPGDPIIFRVRNWVVIDPFVGTSGKTYIPKSSAESVKIVVARKGDPGLLSNQQLVQQIVQGVTSQISPKPTSAPESDQFLADQASELGFTVEQLKSAITEWSKNVQGPYQKGLAALYAHQYPEASTYLQQSISSSENDLVSKYNSLAAAEYGQGHYPAAESALRKAGAVHSDDPLILNDLGVVLDAEAKYGEAEPLLKRTLAIDQKALGPEHPNVATNLNSLATLYYKQGEYAEAEPLIKGALAIDKKALGPEHPGVARDLNNLAVLYHDQGRYSEAEPLYQRALAIDEKALGPEHPRVAATAESSAAVLRKLGRESEAKVYED